MSTLRSFVALFCLLSLSACAHYYKVTDPGTSKVYYTQDVKRNGAAVEFKDAQTGAVTTLNDSQVLEIDKQQYEQAVPKK